MRCDPSVTGCLDDVWIQEEQAVNQMTDIAQLRSRGGSSQYDVEFDPGRGTLWGFFNPGGAPCFNLGLLADLGAHDSASEANNGPGVLQGGMHKAHYYVAAS